MSDQWDSGCESPSAGAAKCELRIVQLAQSARTIVNAVAEPVDAALADLDKAAKQIGRRILKGVSQDIDALEASAGWLTNVLIDPADAALTDLETLRAVCDAQGACVTLQGPQATYNPPSAPESIPGEACNIPSVGQRETPHDVDQANVLILADQNESWHRRLRAWYGGALDSVLLAPSITAAVEAREAQAAQFRADNPGMFAVGAINSPD